MPTPAGGANPSMSGKHNYNMYVNSQFFRILKATSWRERERERERGREGEREIGREGERERERERERGRERERDIY